MEKALATAAELLDKRGFENWEAFGLAKRSALARACADGSGRHQAASESGIGMRASRGGRPGFAFTNALDPGSLEGCAARLEAAVETSSKDPGFRLPAPRRGKAVEEAFDAGVEGTGPPARIATAREAAKAAHASAPASGWTCEALYRDSAGRIAVRNSLGLRVAFRFSRASLHCECSPPDRSSAGGVSAAFGLGPSDLDPQAVGRDALRRASDRADAAVLDPGSRTSLLSPGACALLTGLLAPLLNGEMAGEKRSPWSGLIGEALGSAAATLADDPGLARGYGSTPYDGEGVKTGRVLLVDRGILKCFAQTTSSAVRAGAKGTASAVRAGAKGTASAVRRDYASQPEPGFHNLHVAGGTTSPEGLLADIRDGVYVEELREVKDSGAKAGDVALEGWGYRILRGEKAGPVKGFVIRESLPRLLFKLAAACADLSTFPGGVGGVTCLFEDVPFQRSE